MKLTVLTGVLIATTMSVCARPAAAADGLLIVEKTAADGTVQTNQIQIERNRMRAEIAGRGDAKRVVIFDGAKQVMWMVDSDKKTYNELTRADVERIGGQLQGAMAQVQAQLANMPAAQRAQIEAIMRGRGLLAGGPPQKPDYRKAGTDKVGKWTCEKYERFENNQKISELCTVEPSALGFDVADFDVARQLGEFFKKLLPQNSDQLFTLGRIAEQGYGGIPVRRKFTVLGTDATTELVDITRQTFADAGFAVPAGFKKEEFLSGAERGRGR